MSALSRAQRSMRIIALPLTKVKSSPDPFLKANAVFNTNRMLIYYHCNLVSPPGVDTDQPWTKTVLKKMSMKAADVWAGFGKAPEGTWKLRVYEYGERIVDRIDFEELALKSVDPSLGPSLRTPDATENQTEKLAQHSESSSRVPEVPLIYPPSVYPPSLGSDSVHPALAPLRALLNGREPRHRRGFYLWMIIAPFTAPFALIPVIPNLPFFFCAWRSWSHYKAYRSSQYLSSLLDHGVIVPQPSAELDKLYASFAEVPHTSGKSHLPASLAPGSSESKSKSASTASGTHSRIASSSETSPPSGDSHHPRQRLLTRKAIPQILNLFDLPQSAAADMYRAVEQVRGRLGGSRF